MPPSAVAAAPVTLLAELVAIDSGNPQTAGGPGEDEIAAFAVSWLSARGIACRTLRTAGARPVVVAQSPAGGPVGLNLVAHLDTLLGPPRPPRVADGRLHGIGAADPKACVAVALLATAAAIGSGAGVRCVLSSDEEHASTGLRAVVGLLTSAPCLVLEPTGLAVVAEHAGRHDILLTGSGRRDLAVCGLALRAFAREHACCWLALQAQRTGGDRWELLARWRLAPEARVSFPVDVGDVVRWCVRRGRASRWQVVADRPPLRRGPGAAEAALLRGLSARGEAPAYGALDGWTEAGLISAAGGDAVVFGPGSGGTHTTGEWVDLGELARAAEVVTETVHAF